MRTTILILIILSTFSLAFSQADENGLYNSIENLNQDEQLISKPFPNPVKVSAQINYALPDGVYKGVIVIFNILGNEVKRINVDDAQQFIIIKASDFKDGTYFYQLEYAGTYTGTKRLIISR